MKLKYSNYGTTKKKSNCDETQKTQFATKFKNSNCDETQKLILWEKKLKTQNVTKWRKNNSNCDKTKKLKWWQNSKTQIVTKV